MADTPIKYIVKEKSLIGNELHEAGAEVVLPEGTLPAENLEAICARGEAKKAEYVESNAKRVALMKANFADSSAGDTAALSKAIGAAVAEAIAAQASEGVALKARIAELEAAAVKGSKKTAPDLA
ncbi:hypothetical protein UFOVP61_2 [uncultured Caudovirales phage]|uniref:Uncharacterized protein n=1 Tax=uncultured Caudovirales phage TaxID=2100421 RepID=A0A6J5KQ15_9CAUD|nr:hypothetical protein UFOVP61_2 [uncultured Caudovirales phage]